MSARIEKAVVSGVFSLDGQDFDVDDNVWLVGDTLFHGGPGATGRSYNDEPTILNSIRARLLSLPGDTVVKTGHGEDTTIAAEEGHVG